MSMWEQQQIISHQEVTRHSPLPLACSLLHLTQGHPPTTRRHHLKGQWPAKQALQHEHLQPQCTHASRLSWQDHLPPSSATQLQL